MKGYKFNVEITLDTEEKLESDFIEGLTELLNDEIGDICKVSVKEDTKWQKLKEWVDRVLQAYLNDYDEKIVGLLNDIIDKMQKLEAEDVED